MFAYTHRRRNALTATLLLHLAVLFAAPWLLPAGAQPPEPPPLEIELTPLAATPSPQAAVSPAADAAQAAVSRSSSPQLQQALPELGDVTAALPAAAPAAGSANGSAPTAGSAAPAGQSKTAGGGSIQQPSILSRVAPDYPAASRQAGHEGSALLRVQILESGRCGSISLVRSSGDSALDEAAIAAMRQWRFVPARLSDSGVAVSCYTTIPVTFRLQ